MKWFGEGWTAPLCTPENIVPVPKQPCFHCEGHFNPDDKGVVVPGPYHEEVAYHRNCMLWELGLTNIDPKAD